MAKFDQAIPIILKHEGGLADNPKDRGGVTKFGISMRFLQKNNIDINLDGAVTRDDIIELTLDGAKKLYKKHFWKFDGIESQELALAIFDRAVVSGIVHAIQLLQRSLNALGEELLTDGVCGPKTCAAANRHEATQTVEIVRAYQKQYYEHIIANDPTQDRFRRTWMARNDEC